MSAISDRYDRAAARYQKWWAPVLEETAVRVIAAAPKKVTPLTATMLELHDVGIFTRTT